MAEVIENPGEVIGRFLRGKQLPQPPSLKEESPKEESPAMFQIVLPLSTGHWPLITESYSDGSWAVYFKDSPDIIAGSNVSLEDALDGLSDIILNDIRDSSEEVSEYLKKRRQFLFKIFGP